CARVGGDDYGYYSSSLDYW
nr:immunoglobulin heavy chain junction region [Macaca mulatta]